MSTHFPASVSQQELLVRRLEPPVNPPNILYAILSGQQQFEGLLHQQVSYLDRKLTLGMQQIQQSQKETMEKVDQQMQNKVSQGKWQMWSDVIKSGSSWSNLAMGWMALPANPVLGSVAVASGLLGMMPERVFHTAATVMSTTTETQRLLAERMQMGVNFLSMGVSASLWKNLPVGTTLQNFLPTIQPVMALTKAAFSMQIASIQHQRWSLEADMQKSTDAQTILSQRIGSGIEEVQNYLETTRKTNTAFQRIVEGFTVYLGDSI